MLSETKDWSQIAVFASFGWNRFPPDTSPWYLPDDGVSYWPLAESWTCPYDDSSRMWAATESAYLESVFIINCYRLKFGLSWLMPEFCLSGVSSSLILFGKCGTKMRDRLLADPPTFCPVLPYCVEWLLSEQLGVPACDPMLSMSCSVLMSRKAPLLNVGL